MNYLVIKKGVYIQDVFGPLDTPVHAKALAQLLAAADVDSYHDWEVHSVSIRGGIEGEPLASYRKIETRKPPFWNADWEAAIKEDRARSRGESR